MKNRLARPYAPDAAIGPSRPDVPPPALVPISHPPQGLSADVEPSLKMGVIKAVLRSIEAGAHAEALEVLRSLMSDPGLDAKTRIRAADALAKHHEAVLPKRAESVNLTEVRVMREMTDEELLAIRSRLSEGSLIDVKTEPTPDPESH